jgi:hypothetical protein
MTGVFISHIHNINQVQHLQNLAILLSETARKHLIATIKNMVISEK